MKYTALIYGVTELAAGASRQRLVETRLEAARQLSSQGRYPEAIASYRDLLNTFRNHAGAWHELALLHLTLGDELSAAASLIESIRLDPWRAQAHHSLGRMDFGGNVAGYLSALALGEPSLAAARAACADALHHTPSPDNYLRLAHLQIGQLDVAGGVETLLAAIAAGFETATVSNSLADGYELLGRTRDAQICRGHARYLGHEYAEAIDQYSKVIATPAGAQVYARLATALAALRRYPDAVAACRAGISQHADDQVLSCLLAQVLHEDGQLDAARRVATDASKRFPENLRLRHYALLSLPIVYETAHDVDVHRDGYANGLNVLTKQVLHERQPVSLDTAHALGTSFFLPYQGGDDRALQMQFAALQVHLASAREPQWSHPCPMPALAPGRRLRVGYVSAHLYRHTVAKLFLGWLQERPRERIEAYVYHLGSRIDPMTQQYQRAADHFRHKEGAPRSISRQIADDRLHVLVYLDVGMDELTTQLAASHLAPVQCAAWGHPVTTGLPTIDYFISSELMEPPGAEAHYSEKLVRLPGIGVNVPPPFLEQPRRTRGDFGLADDDCVYLSPQSASKYLPHYDDLFCRIAARVPNSRFVFLESASRHVTAALKNRLLAAFVRHGLDGQRHLVFLPPLSHRDYLDLNCSADVFLDQPGWSGGMTSLEALGCDLPLVTWPGPFMRGRHSSAFLRVMGLDSLIASGLDDYVDLAVRLGADSVWRQDVRNQTAAGKHLVFNDASCVSALEDFYFDAVSRRQGE